MAACMSTGCHVVQMMRLQTDDLRIGSTGSVGDASVIRGCGRQRMLVVVCEVPRERLRLYRSCHC